MTTNTEFYIRPKGKPIPNYNPALCWNCQVSPRQDDGEYCSKNCAFCFECCVTFNERFPQPTRGAK